MNSAPIELSASPKATRREWIGLAVIALPCLLYSMDLNVLNLAIPHITADLNAGAPTNPDGTLNLLHYAAWLVRESQTGEGDAHGS